MVEIGKIVGNVEMEPCPFCGGSAYIVMIKDSFYAMCDTCTRRVLEPWPKHKTYEKRLLATIEAWNTSSERISRLMQDICGELSTRLGDR